MSIHFMIDNKKKTEMTTVNANCNSINVEICARVECDVCASAFCACAVLVYAIFLTGVCVESPG